MSSLKNVLLKDYYSNPAIIILTMIIMSTTACVSYKPKYNGEWQRHNLQDDAFYTVYLIGDAGNAVKGEPNIVFDHLKYELDQESDQSAIVWLGDNIYPIGLAPKNSVYHQDGRYKLQAQLHTMTNYKGKKYFVPGNHDWYTYGRLGLRRQELLIDSFLQHTPNDANQLNYFLPDKGCGDPQTVELTEGIKLLLMDSQWFLNDELQKGDQSVCDVKTSEEFLEKLNSEIENNSDQTLIVASHHPPYTYAKHGGKFSLKSDLFPLTQTVDWLYIPLPIIGYLYNRLSVRTSEQDVFHPNYKTYRDNLSRNLEAHGNSIVASGHEHTLQFIENENQYYVVSGSGSKTSEVGMGKGSLFSTGQKGYAKLVFKNKNQATIQFIVPGQFQEHNNIAYEKEIEF
jgi:predicted phosphodiesterase